MRKAQFPINELFISRWSPRAMSGEPISNQELMSLFEAARWAQSSFNNQPWRFVYAHRDTPAWQPLFDLMVLFNQEWAKRAAVLLVVLSHKNFEKTGKPSRTHSFDTGAACMNLALQGHLMGLVVHGMEGFDYDKARTALQVPQDYDVEAMFAIGKPGDVSVLPPEMQAREIPSDRKPVEAIIFEGRFGG